MNRVEFMKKLEELLRDVSESEREEAIQYYNDYFDDAGVENESQVLESLGTPEKVAAIIKNGLGEKIDAEETQKTTGFYTENGYKEKDFSDVIDAPKINEPEGKKKGLDTWVIVLIIIGCVILSPAIIPAVCSIFGIVLGAVCALLGIIVGFAFGGAALVICGVILFVIGIAKLLAGPAAALLLMGIGLLLFGIGLLMLLAMAGLAGKVLPALIEGIVKLCKMPFEKKGDNK